MIIRHVNPEETEAWLGMRTALWPETEEQQHRKEMAMMLSDAHRLAVFACHAIAVRRGANPVFWGLMGLVFGPLAIPFAFLATPKRRG